MTKSELKKAIEEAERSDKLDLGQRGLTSLPPEIARLTNLQVLYLYGNQLTALPPEIARLTNLRVLNLDGNQLTSLPPGIARLTNLQRLDLDRNQLVTLSPVIARLTSLIYLFLSTNRLTTLPPEIARLTNLQVLYLYDNQLTTLPPEIARLTNLQLLNLGGNRLTSLPPEIARLTDLEQLHLSGNQLTTLPPEIARLSKLQFLSLDGNQLTALPPEIARLTNLQELRLSRNQLTSLPPEIACLTNLKKLGLDNNPLTSPPPAIVSQGTEAIFAFLRSQLEALTNVWRSKLLLVGQGGVGKTCLLRALCGESFEPQLPTTHGIAIRPLPLSHPNEPGVSMDLNAWDFGGQEIYHATHQFFLSDRSLFLLVWNARQEWEQGKLYYWLDTIQALAPESPVMLVTTWIDERSAALPFEDLKQRYPQIRGSWAVSNLTGHGIQELREAIAREAAGLPLMGEKWPSSWLAAADAISARQERFVKPARLREMMAAHGVVGESQEVLARWLHELGEILYFQEREDLNDTVILKPQWVTSAISRVLESKEVFSEKGILTRAQMEELWNDVDPPLHEHFLRLMEQFDLSYRTLEDRDISIVVELLSLDPPDYQAAWEAIQDRPNTKEISMDFEFGSTLPAGIPTWFIARSHRFTTRIHWRYGALLADGDRQHMALVRAFPHDRRVRLTARGPFPHNFFALLKDGFELTRARFPGLQVTRRIPWPGHSGTPCNFKFDYELLQKGIEKTPPVQEVQCQVTFESVSLPGLLFGIHWRTQDRVIERIGERIDQLEAGNAQRHRETLSEIRELRDLAQRSFLALFRLEQESVDACCPNVFVLRPHRTGSLQTLWMRHGQTIFDELGETAFWQKVIGEKLELHLFCQAPGNWHPTDQEGAYVIDEPAGWIRALEPYLQKIVPILKSAAPVTVAAAQWALSGVDAESFKSSVEFMKVLAEKLPEAGWGSEFQEIIATYGGLVRTEGAELRALRRLLEKLDPNQHWGGLRRTATPEGHYLWLCKYHFPEYQ